MTRDAPPDPDQDQNREFSEARERHKDILTNPEIYPDGWVEHARFKERYDLPPFRPPRFGDGSELHETVSSLEKQHDVELSFVSYDVTEGWVLEIDGEQAFTIDRHRDDAANVVIPMSAARFRDRVESIVDGVG